MLSVSAGRLALQTSLFRLSSPAKRRASSWSARSSDPLIESAPALSVLSARLSERLRARAEGRPLQSRDAHAVVETIKENIEAPGANKKKKKKKKKAKAREAIERRPLDIEGWEEGWGEDDLKADAEPDTQARGPPPHVRFPVDYSRRLEGLLEDIPKTVLQDLSPPTKQHPIVNLHHGLDRVLFNPGVHWLRDPRSRVYNFPPALGIIPKVFDFAFERLTGFIRSSRDQDLWALAKQEGRKFGGSTSSLSGMLCHIYFLLSGNKTVDTSALGLEFRREAPTFTPGQRMPASVIFNYHDGVYSIDSSSKSSDADKNILVWMGMVLEKYLTVPSEEFLSYIRSHRTPSEKLTEEPMREAYRYSKSDKFVMRSQLDCHDSRLPGTGVFDIKTRACLPIRMDILNFEENSGYVIRRNSGFVESFEREYYDLIRSAFLKYQFQARIGNMDGVFVAYHNTARLFGFQYVSLEEMDQRLFGAAPGAGDRVFQKSIELLELVSEEIASCFPGQSVKCMFETQDGVGKDLNIWVEPYSANSGNEENNDQPGPIKQITVSANSYYGETPSKGARCVGDMEKPWTVHWVITHLPSGPAKEPEIRAALQGAYDRQFRAYAIPTGVAPDKIREWWETLDFSGKKRLQIPIIPSDDEGSEGVEMDSSAPLSSDPLPDSFFEMNFIEPGERIQALRDLANVGRAETIKIGLEDRGKPKVVFGIGEVDWEDTLAEEEIARKEAATTEETQGEMDSRAIHDAAERKLSEMTLEESKPDTGSTS
ncbi:hypothetical protein GYMLUDRAFT_33983 [Collybiopsis luxurians FD-317 M1]|nr:hypothetical protein GYMLUDRAFT_33983 [Collybiopsis luxurians FD-317 M1]